MKSIRSKIMVVTIAIVLIALAVTGTVASVLNYSSTVETLSQTMRETVKIASQRVSVELAGYKRLVQEMANTVAKSRNMTIDDCNRIAQENGFISFDITTKEGMDLTGANVSDRE